MSSSTRKCWAKKVRDYLMFKAKLLDMKVATESELLSMLNTAEIKTIGGEILLTWGGPMLSSIINPEVNHEVLMEVALTKPSKFLNNGVTYNCVQQMAKTMLELMLHHEKKNENFVVLSHTHNLLPYTPDKILEFSASHEKNFFRTVLKKDEKQLCLKRAERERVRKLIIKVNQNISINLIYNLIYI